MTRSTFIVSVLVVLTACGPSHSPETTNPAPADSAAETNTVFTYEDEYIKIEPMSLTQFEAFPAFDPQKDYDKSSLAEKHNDSLTLMIGTEAVIFTDTLTKTENEMMRFNAHLGDLLDYHVVETDYYEAAEWILVNKSNGKRFILFSEPKLSPGHKYIATHIGYGMEDPVYQLWEVNASGLTKKFRLPTAEKGFSIEELRWINDNSQAVKISFGAEREVYGRLTIK